MRGDTDIVQYLIANIEHQMRARGYTNAGFAREAGLNPTGVRDIRSGRVANPGLVTIAKIAEALGVTAAELIEDPGRGRDRNTLQDAFARLSPADRKRITVTARAWLTEFGAA